MYWLITCNCHYISFSHFAVVNDMELLDFSYGSATFSKTRNMISMFDGTEWNTFCSSLYNSIILSCTKLHNVMQESTICLWWGVVLDGCVIPKVHSFRFEIIYYEFLVTTSTSTSLTCSIRYTLLSKSSFFLFDLSGAYGY